MNSPSSERATADPGRKIRAVVFDLGGVCVGSPVHAIRRYERWVGLPANYIGVCIGFAGEQGPFQRFERGELAYEAFVSEFTAWLREPRHVQVYCKWYARQQRAADATAKEVDWERVAAAAAMIDGRALFESMMLESSVPVEPMVAAIERIRASGQYVLCCITNDFPVPADLAARAPAAVQARIAHLMAQFDVVVRSSVVGLRKPDPAIYRALLEAPGFAAAAHECVFLDDLAVNIRAAQRVGMQTIWVRSAEQALRELEAELGLDLGLAGLAGGARNKL
ncbi:hypothetical protein H9P43_005479 [Blastocladiella emersonii ATCC 22665]|nr:hypothetical protein H9P43_005479 [Blastocladiella emersonii ATCC 22665]